MGEQKFDTNAHTFPAAPRPDFHSQKSAPVAVAVIASVAASVSSLGAMCVPAIICQLTQVFSNQPLAYAFRAWTRRAGVASATATPAASVRGRDVERGGGGGGK